MTMKKLIVFATVMVIGAGVAMGATLTVPFFFDQGDSAVNNFPPTVGNMSFIGIKNNTASDIEVQVTYADPSGDIDPSNTFLLKGGQGLSWRPFADDVGIEGADGNSVGDATFQAGSAVLSWAGDAFDIQGRMAQFAPGGNVFGYLLPKGPGSAFENDVITLLNTIDDQTS